MNRYMNKFNFNEGDKVKGFAGTGYEGEVVEVEEEGFWLTEDYQMQEYIAFIEVETFEVI
jgi:hypothetical protein